MLAKKNGFPVSAPSKIFYLTINENVVEFFVNKINKNTLRACKMTHFNPIAKARYLIFLLILTTYGCSHNSGSLNQDKGLDERASYVVSTRNPDFVIQPPVTFTWLPEPIQVFEDPRSKALPIQEVFRKAIAESLTNSGYEFQQSMTAWKSGASSVEQRTDIGPKDVILVKNWEWAGANFGAGGILKEITLENTSKEDFKDPRLKIDYLGTTGPKEGYGGPTSIFVIHDSLPSNTIKTFKDINVGFRHPDEKREQIIVLNAKRTTSDLLIGFTLARESWLTDQEISQNYGIAPGLPSTRDRINGYEKGTVIIDVADAETRTLIWRGALQALPRSDIPDDARRERISESVKILIDNFIDSLSKM